MPNNRKHTLKNIKAKHVAHPYSRKANQITRSLLRTDRLAQQKKERVAGSGRTADRYLWFRDMLMNTERELLTRSELLELVSIYVERHDEELERLRKQRKYGNRPKSAREDLLESLQTKEQADFQGNGLDVPDLTIESNVNTLYSWKGDNNGMAQIRKMRVHSRMLSADNEASDALDGTNEDNVLDNIDDGNA
ncbi:hypothetical protein BDF19DRAFT_451053 [Syncephalis fuscata]|nr:hypothetical protein BDF19DRAFT_451053 [Syncephalis fuscata]